MPTSAAKRTFYNQRHMYSTLHQAAHPGGDGKRREQSSFLRPQCREGASSSVLMHPPQYAEQQVCQLGACIVTANDLHP